MVSRRSLMRILIDWTLRVNGGAKLVRPGGAKLVHLTLCGAKQRGRFLWTHRVNHCTSG